MSRSLLPHLPQRTAGAARRVNPIAADPLPLVVGAVTQVEMAAVAGVRGSPALVAGRAVAAEEVGAAAAVVASVAKREGSGIKTGRVDRWEE
jgi:hypothetical protein